MVTTNAVPTKIKDVAQAELPPVPPRPAVPAGSTLREKMMLSHDYYEANKASIIAEWEKLGRPVTLKRWGISQSTLNGLLARWGLKPKPAKKHRASSAGSADEPSPEKPVKPAEKVSKGDRSKPESVAADKGKKLIYLGRYTVEEDKGLPEFPVFDKEWDSETRREWFRTFAGLKALETLFRRQ